MLYVTHRFSDKYDKMMNKLAQITKAGALLILADYDVNSHEIADDLEWRYLYKSAADKEDYDTLRKHRVSYTSSDELITSVRTYGFYLIALIEKIGSNGQYIALFRKSKAPSGVYIPTYTHPVYSIEAENVHSKLGVDMSDRSLHDSYTAMMQ
jgi:hypothetical protein